MYIGLSLLALVYPEDLISELRVHLCSFSLKDLRERVLMLMAVITDLALIPSHYLQFGTHSLTLLDFAIIDVMFGGSSARPRTFSFSLLNFSLIYFFSGFTSKVKLSPVLLGQWLITSQTVVADAHRLYTHPSCMTDPFCGSDLESELLCLVQPEFLNISPFELHYPNCIVINDECTPSQP